MTPAARLGYAAVAVSATGLFVGLGLVLAGAVMGAASVFIGMKEEGR